MAGCRSYFFSSLDKFSKKIVRFWSLKIEFQFLEWVLQLVIFYNKKITNYETTITRRRIYFRVG